MGDTYDDYDGPAYVDRMALIRKREAEQRRCYNCAGTLVYCDACWYLDSAPCCDACEHVRLEPDLRVT